MDRAPCTITSSYCFSYQNCNYVLYLQEIFVEGAASTGSSPPGLCTDAAAKGKFIVLEI